VLTRSDESYDEAPAKKKVAGMRPLVAAIISFESLILVAVFDMADMSLAVVASYL